MASSPEQEGKENQDPKLYLFQPIKTNATIEGFHIRRSNGNGVVIGEYPRGVHLSLFITEWDRSSRKFDLSVRANIPPIGIQTEHVYPLQIGETYRLIGTPCMFRTELIQYKGLNLIDFTFHVPSSVLINRLERFSRGKRK